MYVWIVLGLKFEFEAGSESSLQPICLVQQLLFVVYHPGREELTKRGDPARVIAHEL
jgi:hypothetical protein